MHATLDRLLRWSTGLMAAVALFAIMWLTFVDVMGRKFLSHSVPGGLEMTTSKDVLEAMSSGAGPRRVLVTLGCSGWSAGQLEDEIGRNGWLTVDADPAVIFDTPVEKRYERAVSLLGFDPRMLSQEAGHA